MYNVVIINKQPKVWLADTVMLNNWKWRNEVLQDKADLL